MHVWDELLLFSSGDVLPRWGPLTLVTLEAEPLWRSRHEQQYRRRGGLNTVRAASRQTEEEDDIGEEAQEEGRRREEGEEGTEDGTEEGTVFRHKAFQRIQSLFVGGIFRDWLL